MIPTYNERENLQELVYKTEEVLSRIAMKGYLIIVDDNSPDGTGELAEQLAKKYNNIMVIHRPAKLGIGSAYRRAFQTIFESMQVDAVFEMDADLSHDPAYIPGFLEMLKNGFDVVVGSRYTIGGAIEGWPTRRWIISEVANLLARLLLGIEIRDLTSGFRVYRLEALKSINLSEIKSKSYAFQVEMLYHCANAGFRIGEIPILFRERGKGDSKLGNSAILEFMKTITGFSLDKILGRQRSKNLSKRWSI